MLQLKKIKMHNSIAVVCIFCLLFLSAFMQAQTLKVLRADGQKIETVNDQEVILRGVNLGQWLVMEGFMMGNEGGWGQSDVKRWLASTGKTRAAIETYFDSYRANFITKADIDYAASLGFNCVRLPLHYELFLTDAQREERLDVIYATAGTAREAAYLDYKTKMQSWVDGNTLATNAAVDGFTIINNVVSWCKANNMYVILDMHTVPGSVGDGVNITDGLFSGRDFFYDSKNRNALYRIWDKISEKYMNEPAICMYDLINEPHRKPAGSLEDLTAAEMTQLKNSYNQIVTTIRANADNKLILIQGGDYGNDYYSSNVSLYPADFTNKTNLVWNIHRYRADNSTTLTNADTKNIVLFGEAVNFRTTYNVPLFCGETGLDTDLTRLAGNYDAMDQLGIGWTLWSLKSHTDRADPTYDDNRFLLDIGGNDPTEDIAVWTSGSLFTSILFANCSKNPLSGFWSSIAPRYPLVSGRTYKIINYNSGKSLEIGSSSTVDGADAQQYTISGTLTSQRWNAYYNLGSVTGWSLINANSLKALEITGASAADGAIAQQWTNDNGAGKKWWVEWATDGYGYKIQNKNSQKLLEIAASSTANSAKAQQYGSAFTNSRRWILVPVFTVSSSLSGRSANEEINTETEVKEAAGITDFKIMPNPVSDALTVNIPYVNSTTLEMYSSTGQRVFAKSVMGMNTVKIDVSKYSRGTYIIKLSGGEKELTATFTVNR
jgi:endoglucanase